MIWSLPNVLTAARIAAAPCVALVFVLFDRPLADWLALGLFASAVLTDYLDGWLARRYSQVSEVGKMLDPIADKAIVIIALAVLLSRRPDGIVLVEAEYFRLDRLVEAITLPAVLIMLREVIVSGVREYLGDFKLPVTRLAKWKTTVQMLAIGTLLAVRPLSEIRVMNRIIGKHTDNPLMAHKLEFAQLMALGGVVLLWLAAVLTIITGWQYFRKGLAHIVEREAR